MNTSSGAGSTSFRTSIIRSALVQFYKKVGPIIVTCFLISHTFSLLSAVHDVVPSPRSFNDANRYANNKVVPLREANLDSDANINANIGRSKSKSSVEYRKNKEPVEEVDREVEAQMHTYMDIDSLRDQDEDEDEYSIVPPTSMDPIDEFIAQQQQEKMTHDKIPSLHTLLTMLKGHSLPEAYDDEINTDEEIEIETQRCTRYGYEYNHNPSIIKKRRRIFMGSLIADDTWHVIAAHAAEAYGLYHTVAFVESNTTQTMTKRTTRFDQGSLNWRMLQGEEHNNTTDTNGSIFGPRTQVYIDFHVDTAKDYPDAYELMRENLQREHITKRWKDAGMQPDDIGIISDVDEMYTRDFLLALQTCDIPQFRPGQDCFRPKVVGLGLTFEGTPECQMGQRGVSGYFHRPSAMIGECIDQIGDLSVHKPTLRNFRSEEGGHLLGSRNFEKRPNIEMYPLWKPWDFRNSPGEGKEGEHLAFEDGRFHTAFHFHNFFDSFHTLRTKYKTYGHPRQGADKLPLAQIDKSVEDLLKCLKAVIGKYRSFDQIKGRRPVLFEDESYRSARQKEMVKEMEEDESIFGYNLNDTSS